MGGSVSVSTAESITESIIEVANNTNSSTRTQISAQTNITNSAIVDSDISREFEVTMSSLSTFKINNEVIDKIVDNMKAKVKSESSMFTGSAAMNFSKIRTVLKKNFTNNMISECVANIDSQLNIKGSFIARTRISDRIKLVNRCITHNMMENKNISDMVKTIDNDIESQANLLTFGLGGTMIMIVIIIAIVIMFKAFSGDSKPKQPGDPGGSGSWNPFKWGLSPSQRMALRAAKLGTPQGRAASMAV